MPFKFNRMSSSHLTIFDSTYGYGYLILGECEKTPCVGFLDYGLGRAAKNCIAEVIDREREVVETISGFSNANQKKIFTNKHGVIGKIHQLLVTEGFTEDPLDKNHAIRGPLVVERVVPIDCQKRIVEDVKTHLRSKVESVFHCAKIPADIYTFSTLNTTDAKTPFVLVRGRLKEKSSGCADQKKKRKKLQEWFDRLVTDARLVKMFIEGVEVEFGFHPSPASLTKISLQETPRFPPDRIDGYQAVSFEFQTRIPEEKFALLKARILEAGAAVSCLLHENDTIILEIPCCFQLGGVVGRAFESRLSYTLSLLSEELDEPSFDLMERRSLRESVEFENKKAGVLISHPPGQVAFTRKLFTVEESTIPVLFDRVGSDEVFMMCEGGNFLAAQRGDGNVKIFHGVLNKRKCLPNILDYYPALVAAGSGRS